MKYVFFDIDGTIRGKSREITDLGLSALTERKSFWQSYKKVIDRLLEDAL